MTTKECFKCHRVLPLTDFYAHPMMGDGHLGKCKECAKADVRANRVTRVDYYRKYDVKRFQTSRRKDQVRNYLRKQREAHPEKAKCRYYFGNAKRDGRITAPNHCEACGKVCRPEGHHTDYSKPLDVMWLCRKCHGKVHGWYKEQVAS